jgi:hypothetical protein
MKYITIYSIKPLLVLPVLLMVSLISCFKDVEYNTPADGDQTKPGVVTNVKVDNFNGGAYITYTLPNANNLLYILAEYKINDKTVRQTKSSYYSDTIMVEGFAKSQDYEVTLYSVTRANVKSDPIVVKVHPDTPVYELILPSIEIEPDFGGVKIKGINKLKKVVGVVLIALDSSTNAFEEKDQNYTKFDTIRYSVRNLASKEQKFGVYITDKFGNISDTLITTLTPYYETIMDKRKFFEYKLPTDSKIEYGWELYYLWDSKTDGYSAGWHTSPGANPPMQCTFGTGTYAKLNRFELWERPDQYAYSHGNPKDFAIWGSDKTEPLDANIPISVPVGTIVGDWVNLGNYHYPDPPSGSAPGFVNADDIAFVAKGVNFDFPLANPAVRYIRIIVKDTWSNGDFAHLMEISLYGDPQ